MSELVWGQPLFLWLYLAVAGVLYFGWWSIADARHHSDGEIAGFSLFLCLFWGVTLPIALVVCIGINVFAWLERTSGWLSRWVEKWQGKGKK